jgi:hypothetical protein
MIFKATICSHSRLCYVNGNGEIAMPRANGKRTSTDLTPRDERALSAAVAQMRRIVRDLTRTATRMNRTLDRRLQQLEALRQ